MREIEQIIETYLEEFHLGRLNCSETVLMIMNEYYGWHSAAVPRIASAFGGGIAAMQGACGAYTGGAMAIGLLMGRDVPGGDRAPSVSACKALHTYLMERSGATDCKSILADVDFSDASHQVAFRAEGGKHQTVCEPMVADVCRYLAASYPRGESYR